MTKINIAMGMTPNWFQYSLVTITSILMNADINDEYSFYIMSNDFPDIAKKAFNALKTIIDAEFNFILINDKDFDEFPGITNNWLGLSSAYRLKIPDFINESKILYIDSDIIINQNIRELYEYDISNYYIAGVEDKCSNMMKGRLEVDKTPYVNTYVNAGIILMNLDLFRKDNLEHKIYDALIKYNHFNDQDVINYVCKDRILQLPIKYNLMPIIDAGLYPTRHEEVMQALKKPFTIHYTEKPWKNAEVTLSNYWLFYKKVLDEIMKKENIQ